MLMTKTSLFEQYGVKVAFTKHGLEPPNGLSSLIMYLKSLLRLHIFHRFVGIEC